jgi:hypothetical protein
MGKPPTIWLGIPLTPLVVVIAVSFVCVVALLTYAGIHDSPLPSDAPTRAPQEAEGFTTGDTGMVTRASGGAPCFDSQQSLDDATTADAANDHIGYAQAVSAHAIRLRAGDRVRAIGNALGTVNLRIESGENLGASCWIPSEWSEGFAR